jgi:hypothetical protein
MVTEEMPITTARAGDEHRAVMVALLRHVVQRRLVAVAARET